MDPQIKEITDSILAQFGLKHFFLKRHTIFREKNEINETVYILSFEVSPNDENQTGSIEIDVDFHTKELKSIMFINGLSSSKNKLVFPTSDKESVIDWIEVITGLTFGKQFRFEYEDESNFRFQATVDYIDVLPSGTIDVAFDEDGAFARFSIDGVFPEEDKVNWEPFSLIPENVESISKKQFKLMEIPIETDEKWFSFYAIEEVFITNDGKQVVAIDERNRLGMNVVLEWDEPLHEAFQGREIDLTSEVSLDTAVNNEPHPDTFPITESEQEACITGARDFLRCDFPNDSGKWAVKSLRRENSHIIADLYPTENSARAFVQKIRLVIDRETYNVVDFLDSKVFLEMFKHYKDPAEVTVTLDDVFDRLRSHINVVPVYVYNVSKKSYELYGKVDCPYGVDASTGELISLDG